MDLFDPVVRSYYKNKFGGGGSSGGGGGGSVEEKDIRFMDYDGTLLYSYSVDEFAAMTELPPLPEQKGLICQGWNWNLEDIKAMGRAVDVGATYITDDGKTRLYIHLEEGRTAPMVGVCLNGTVTVDWGDGSEPDVLTGTSTSTVKYTPNHEYGKAGDYVISLAIDGTVVLTGGANNNAGAYILRNSSLEDYRSVAYALALQKVELGNGVTSISSNAFYGCRQIKSIAINDGIGTIGDRAFAQCGSLKSCTVPNGVQRIGEDAFNACYALESVIFHNGLKTLSTGPLKLCSGLKRVIIPNSVITMNNNFATNCYNIRSITIPNGLTSISSSSFSGCNALTRLVIPNSVTAIYSSAFQNCYSMKFYDFTTHTSVPTLSSTNVFTGIPADCEIRVPAALYDEWIAATNWATYAANIVAV